MGYTSNKLRVLASSGKDFQITPREMANIADQLDEKDVELTALRERMRWVPVSERLPMDLLNRNVMDAQGNVGTARQRLPYLAGIWDKTGSETLGVITHWKDMPEGFDTGLCASCCGTGLTDLHYCDGVIFQPRLCPCGCPRPLPAAPEVPQ